MRIKTIKNWINFDKYHNQARIPLRLADVEFSADTVHPAPTGCLWAQRDTAVADREAKRSNVENRRDTRRKNASFRNKRKSLWSNNIGICIRDTPNRDADKFELEPRRNIRRKVIPLDC